MPVWIQIASPSVAVVLIYALTKIILTALALRGTKPRDRDVILRALAEMFRQSRSR
jgi:hypothetical protein